MSTLTISGASDDLIEVDGDICDEFNVYLDDEAKLFLAVSDGTVLRVIYDNNGIWRFTRFIAGLAIMSKVDGDVLADTNDVVTLTLDGGFKWVVLGDKLVHKTK